MSLKGHQEPSTGFATSGIGFQSPATSFQSLPSNSSALTVKPEVELPVDLCAADPTHFDPPMGEVMLWACHSVLDTQVKDTFVLLALVFVASVRFLCWASELT